VWVENDRVVNLDPADPITCLLSIRYAMRAGAPANMA
jgi:hypothetical protein